MSDSQSVSIPHADGSRMVLTKLRVPHGLPVATVLEDHHMGTIHAACTWM